MGPPEAGGHTGSFVAMLAAGEETAAKNESPKGVEIVHIRLGRGGDLVLGVHRQVAHEKALSKYEVDRGTGHSTAIAGTQDSH